MRFWFRVYSPHQSLWRTFDAAQKQKLIHDHASTVFEDACRARYDGAARYWEKDIELDIVAKDPQNPKGVVAVEVKWRKLSAQERRNVMSQLQQKWARTALSQKHAQVRFEVMDAMDLLR
jgi:hypothetical protein